MRGQKRAVKSKRSRRGDKIRTGREPTEKAVGKPRTRVPGSETHYRPPLPANPQHEASAQGPAVPGAGPQGLKFHTHLSASIVQLESRGRQETRKGLGVFSLPRSAPAVSTLVTGNNPERVSKARRNSDIVVTPGGSLRRRLLGCTLGPAAAAAAAPSPEPTSVIYKCHWKFFSSMSPASSPSPAWSRMWKVYGCARVGERVRVSASEPLVCLDFSMQGTSDLTSRKEGQ